MKPKTALWIIGIVLVFAFVGIFLSDEEPTITSEVIKEEVSEEENQEETCEIGYLGNFRCDGNNIQRKYQYSNCSYVWIHNYHCAYGCENASCESCYDSDGGKDYYKEIKW